MANNGDNSNKEIEGNRPRILIAIINNTGYMPTYAFNNLIQLFQVTNGKYPGSSIASFNSTEVHYMRNCACLTALDKKFTHIFMIDIDQTYDPNAIINLIGYDKDFVVGTSRSRHHPHLPTHFKKLIEQPEFGSKDNRVFPENEKEIVQIEATGVVGALIKTEVFKKLKFPYFEIKYLDEIGNFKSEDIVLCEKLKELGIKLYLDPNTKYQHEIRYMIDDEGSYPVSD